MTQIWPVTHVVAVGRLSPDVARVARATFPVIFEIVGAGDIRRTVRTIDQRLEPHALPMPPVGVIGMLDATTLTLGLHSRVLDVLQRRWPQLPLLVVSARPPLPPDLLLHAGRSCVVTARVVCPTVTPAVLARDASGLIEDAVRLRVLGRLPLGASHAWMRYVETAVHTASHGSSVAALVQRLQVPARTVRHRIARFAMLRPIDLLQWARRVVTAEWLQHRPTERDAVLTHLGFRSLANARRALTTTKGPTTAHVLFGTVGDPLAFGAPSMSSVAECIALDRAWDAQLRSSALS